MSALDIDDSIIAKLVTAAADGDDPLGLVEKARTGDPETILTTVLNALEGADADVAHRIMRAIPVAYGKRDAGTKGAWPILLPFDVITADLLEHAGIDPLVAAWISIHGGNTSIRDAETKLEMAEINGGVRAGHAMNGSCVTLSENASWHTVGEIRTFDRIPDTIAMAAQNRLLRDVISHPVLDRHLLYIVHIGTDGPQTVISTDHSPKPVTLDELLARAPYGCR